jgi:hypothetical protein
MHWNAPATDMMFHRRGAGLGPSTGETQQPGALRAIAITQTEANRWVNIDLQEIAYAVT